MKAKAPEYVTRTANIVGAAFYYAHGLRFKEMEMCSPEGKGGADNISFVFAGGDELFALTDAFYDEKPDVSYEEIRAFVEYLHGRFRRSPARAGRHA